MPRLAWTNIAPIFAAVILAFAWGRDLPVAIELVVAAVLMAAVLAAVHHAEVVAHRVGEPFGSLVLAVAVTVIEVALIVTLMISNDKDTATLARDTVFAAVMISTNGIVGLCLLVSALKHHLAEFNQEGTGAALATVVSLASLCLVFPSFTTSQPGPEYTAWQLGFAAVASLVLYASFVFTQTVRHRDFFLPVTPGPGATTDGHADDDEDGHADPPDNKTALTSLGLLLVSLVAVVGLAKVESPAIEQGVASLGFPHAVVGVIIALLVLMPETIAAVRNAARQRVQVGLNLGLGSAMASMGLTIPTLAVLSPWLDTPLHLGLDEVQMVLLFITIAAAILTVVPGRAKPLQGVVHLVLLSSFVFLTIAP